MTIDTEEQLAKLRQIGRIVADCLQHMLGSLEEGMSTADLDQIGHGFLKAHGARSAPQLTYNFPGVTCISVGSEAAHGIPSTEKNIGRGQLVNIDVSAELDGYFADTGASILFRGEDPYIQGLCLATRQALGAAIQSVRANALLSVIGQAIETQAAQTPYNVVRNLSSHGVGQALHEEPRMIPSYYDPYDRRRIHEGMVFTIEPFLTTGSSIVRQADDGWTLYNADGGFSAQYEHTLVATKDGALVITEPSRGQAFHALVGP